MAKKGKVAGDMSKEGLYEELSRPEELFRKISNIAQQKQQHQPLENKISGNSRKPSKQVEHPCLDNCEQKEEQKQQQHCHEETNDCRIEGFYEEFGKPPEYLHLVNNSNNNNNNNNDNNNQQQAETENAYEPIGSSVIRVGSKGL